MGYMEGINGVVGENLALKVISGKEEDEWGETVNETTDEKTVTGVVEILDADSDIVQEGDWRGGDLRAFFDKSVSDIDEGNILVKDGREYEIHDAAQKNIGSEGHIEVRARPV